MRVIRVGSMVQTTSNLSSSGGADVLRYREVSQQY